MLLHCFERIKFLSKDYCKRNAKAYYSYISITKNYTQVPLAKPSSFLHIYILNQSRNTIAKKIDHILLVDEMSTFTVLNDNAQSQAGLCFPWSLQPAEIVLMDCSYIL